MVVLPKQGQMLRENLNKVTAYKISETSLKKNLRIFRIYQHFNTENSVHGGMLCGEFLYRSLSQIMNVTENRWKCYSRYNTQLIDKAPNYQLIVIWIQASYSKFQRKLRNESLQNFTEMCSYPTKNCNRFCQNYQTWQVVNNIHLDCTYKKISTYSLPQNTLSTDKTLKSYCSIISRIITKYPKCVPVHS